jgi:phosphate-selective porin
MLFGGTKLADMLPVSYSVGIYNGCGRVDQCTTDNDGDKEFTARLTFAPPMPVGNLTLGLNGDYRKFDNKKGGARDLATNPGPAGTNFHVFNPTSVLGDAFGGNGQGTSTNGFRINGNRHTGGADFVYDLYPFLFTGEFHYASQQRDKLGPGGSNLDDLQMYGGYGTIGYWVFGNKLKGLLVNGRYEHLRVDDTKGKFQGATGNTEDELRVRVGTMGATWYLNPNIFVRANYVLTYVNPGKNFFGVSNNTQGELTHQGIAEAVFKF